jgi:calcineurin-like phosphoesterase family protein
VTRFFTADEHFGHANIIRYSGRPFTSSDDMDEALIEAWAGTVGPKDEVWVLGDFALGPIYEALDLAQLLPGRKTLVPGNHDRCWSGHRKRGEKWVAEYEAAGFRVVGPPVELRLAGRDVLLHHFPYRDDGAGSPKDESRYALHRPVDAGKWLLHGHVHEKWRQRGHQINVGVDAWAGRPVAEAELARLMDAGPADKEPLPWGRGAA